MREGHLIERGVYLQVRSIVDIAFFFDTRQTTSLHYNLFTLNHINILTGISSSEGEVNGFTASLSSTKIDS